MKNHGLFIALLAGYFLSCSTLSNITQRKYYAPEIMMLDLSHDDKVCILEDTDGDRIFDTSFDYDETRWKPDYIPGNSKEFYLLKRSGFETIVPLPKSGRDQVPAPLIPEYENNPFDKNLKLDAKWAY
jgi:hypothetical protein